MNTKNVTKRNVEKIDLQTKTEKKNNNNKHTEYEYD